MGGVGRFPRVVAGVCAVVLLAGTLLLQFWVLPGVAAQFAFEAPELAHLRIPVLAAGILGVIPVQIVLVELWRAIGILSNPFEAGRSKLYRLAGVVRVASLIAIAGAVLSFFVLPLLGAGQPGVQLLLLGYAAAFGLICILARRVGQVTRPLA